MKWWGLGRSLAMVALVVQAPRLILSILDADQITISPSTRQSLLIIAAIGTASILTGGQLYLIHVIGTCSKWRSGLVIIWLGVLTFSGAMIIPSGVWGSIFYSPPLRALPRTKVVVESNRRNVS